MMNSPALLTIRERRRMPSHHAEPVFDHGRISPSRPRLFGVMTAIVVLACMAVPTGATEPGAGLLVLAAVTLAAVAALGTGLRAGCDLYWNEDGLEGPAAMLGLPFAPMCSFIAWDSVVLAGTDAFGRSFIVDAQGNRICWNPVYAGTEQLRATIVQACPHLFTGRIQTA